MEFSRHSLHTGVSHMTTAVRPLTAECDKLFVRVILLFRSELEIFR